MERTYFQVYLPKESKDSSKPMFFCSKWSVGKVVDYAASLASLKNNNNVQAAKVMGAHWYMRPLTQHLTHHCLLILIVDSLCCHWANFYIAPHLLFFFSFYYLHRSCDYVILKQVRLSRWMTPCSQYWLIQKPLYTMGVMWSWSIWTMSVQTWRMLLNTSHRPEG